jgi:hypothetical protein
MSAFAWSRHMDRLMHPVRRPNILAQGGTVSVSGPATLSPFRAQRSPAAFKVKKS